MEIRNSENNSPHEHAADAFLKKAGKKNFLFIYAFSLLTIALVLILLSYVWQVRASKQEIEELQDEHSSFSLGVLSSIENLQKENERLKTESGEMSEQLAELGEINSSLKNELLSSQQEKTELSTKLVSSESEVILLIKTVNIISAYDNANTNSEYASLAGLIAAFEKDGFSVMLKAYSPFDKTPNSEASAAYSELYDKYCVIAEKLVKRKFLQVKNDTYILSD
jgi:septal ring factor EnvC (AmiA/AmiB activator)